jgi:hypothetical protein
MADKDELLNYADREAVEKAMKKLTLNDIDECRFIKRRI